jgi:hypothetical protein
METNGLLSFTAIVIFCCLHSVHSAPTNRYRRQVNQSEAIVFQLGNCLDCQKLLMRDYVARRQPWYSDVPVNTILSYDGVGRHTEERIDCVKITDRSSTCDGANVDVILGDNGQPYIKLNITAGQPGKGYCLCVEIRGYNPLRPDCE